MLILELKFRPGRWAGRVVELKFSNQTQVNRTRLIRIGKEQIDMAVYIFPTPKALMTGTKELHRRRNNAKIETAIVTHVLSPCHEVNSEREGVAGVEGPQERKRQQQWTVLFVSKK